MSTNRMPGSFFYPDTLVHLLRHRAEHNPDDLAFVYLVNGENEEQRLTYAELDAQARAIGAWLESAGLEGQRALMLYPAGLEFVKAFFGCLYAGVTAVPTNPPRRNHKLGRIESIVRDAGAKVALTTETLLEQIQPLLEDSAVLKSLPWQATDFVLGADDWIMPDCSPETLAFLQYTSGSTGTPKGVMLSHANLMHNSALICHAFEHTRTGKGVFWLPSYHDMGLIGGVVQPIYVGRTNVLLSPMAFLQKPVRWLAAISKYRGTTSGGPNFAYDLCVEKITDEQMEGIDLSSWLVAPNGAEPVRAETLDRFTDKFSQYGFRRQTFYPCYGMAEATLIVTGGYVAEDPVVKSFDGRALEENHGLETEDRGPYVRRLVGCGKTLPDQRVLIVDPEKLIEVNDGDVGEIWVQGPSIAHGYLARPEETEETFGAHLADTGEGPFYRTGDLGFLFDGELFVTGRRKDLIIIRGKNHYPQDIETTVAACHPRLVVDSGAAFSIDEDGQEKLVVVQEVDRDRNRNHAEIFSAIRKAVATQHDLMVDTIALVRMRSIPKTSSGKIQRYACRDMFMSGEIGELDRWTVGDPLPETSGSERADSSKFLEPKPAGSPAPESVVPVNGSVRKPNGEQQKSRLAKQSKPLPQGTIRELVEAEIRRVGKERVGELKLESNIVELGLDSLERMEIVATLEDTFGGRFPESVLVEMETLSEVIDAVEQYLGGSAQGAAPRPDDYQPEPSTYDFAQFPEYEQLKQTEQILMATGVPNPYFSIHEAVAGGTTRVDGRELINFSTFNYIGMSGEPRVSRAAKQAIDQYGTSVSASRLVSGEKVVHRELEQKLASFIGVEDAMVLASGHATNETVIGHMVGPGDLIVHDALAHNSIVQGAMLSGARRRPFAHNDWRDLDRILDNIRHDYRRVLVAIEGVYSMDGDFPDLPKFVEVKRKHRALLMIDEAHSIGTMGATGRGIAEHFAVAPRDVDVWMGTISKALGNCGGYIAGSNVLIEYLKYTTPGFIFTTGLSPPMAAGALEAIRVLEEQP
ncbi:MAG: aminotransferase class I/II-fold pyridoxal phosphate-dependent enzyme, partial [Pirellulales bacterium]